MYSEAEFSTLRSGKEAGVGMCGPKARRCAPPTGIAPTATVIAKTSATQALLYRFCRPPAPFCPMLALVGRLNGGYSALHADPAVGRKLGF